MRLLPQVLPFLMAITLLSLSEGCATNFPTVHPAVLDVPHGKCGLYSETNMNPLTFVFQKWVPLSQCNGYFAFPPSDVAAVRTWYDDQREAQ